jgi:hypothetical protein
MAQAASVDTVPSSEVESCEQQRSGLCVCLPYAGTGARGVRGDVP